MRFIAPVARRHLRKALAAAALLGAATLNLAACGQVVERANLGRCATIPGGSGTICEEIGGEYIVVDALTGTMRRVSAGQAEFIARASAGLAYAQATNSSGGSGGQRNCLANPSIACSGSLNNRVTGYRSGGYSGVCSGGTCLSMGR